MMTSQCLRILQPLKVLAMKFHDGSKIREGRLSTGMQLNLTMARFEPMPMEAFPVAETLLDLVRDSIAGNSF